MWTTIGPILGLPWLTEEIIGNIATNIVVTNIKLHIMQKEIGTQFTVAVFSV